MDKHFIKIVKKYRKLIKNHYKSLKIVKVDPNYVKIVIHWELSKNSTKMNKKYEKNVENCMKMSLNYEQNCWQLRKIQ